MLVNYGSCVVNKILSSFRPVLLNTSGTTTITFPGRYYYEITMRGGGAAGGSTGATGNNGAGGNGGAGDKGELTHTTIFVPTTKNAQCTVGAGGLTKDNGGNGGIGGTGYGRGGNGGAGGGGGYPSYIIFDPEITITDYYGWSYTPGSSRTFTSETITFYVTYDDPRSSINISKTPQTYTWTSFTLTKGVTYTNGQQVAYASDSATVRVNLDISNGTVYLRGTATNTFGVGVTPLEITSDFQDNIALTQSISPQSGDTVYDTSFNPIGIISNSNGTSFVYNSQTYTRYSTIDTSIQTQINGEIISANGGAGGGGGGGGGTTSQERYRYGAGGGGGGGYYKFNNGSITAINGVAGGNGGSSQGASGIAGGNGNTTDFPDVYAGQGGFGGDWNSSFWNGAAGGAGGGAGGGGGGAGWSNSDWSFSGVGGGGAGGSETAGGGEHGHGYHENEQATDAYNYYTTPIDPTSENASYGVNANYGIGGTSDTNGTDGFIYIRCIGRRL